ncbi:MAG: PilZ domain-containing protein [Thermodesulfobacteriota bacterium]|nr:PilZ domain-containing protein [Thermodesulfobacteriota bacterium]
MTEKRHFERVKFVEQASVQVGKSTLPCKLIDISLKGSLLQFTEGDIPELNTDQDCLISLQLEGSDIVLEFHASATHCQQNTIGFHFTSMDSDSMLHLRRLLELNTGDTEEIDRELSYMLKGLG